MVSFTRTYLALGLLAATATAAPQSFKMKFSARPILIQQDETEATQWKTSFINAMNQANWVATGYTRYQNGGEYWGAVHCQRQACDYTQAKRILQGWGYEESGSGANLAWSPRPGASPPA